MPRGPAPAWTQRKEPVLDDWIWASVNRSGGIGKHHPETGHYGELLIQGIETPEEAAEYKRALYRCAHYMHRHGTAELSMNAKIEKAPGGGYQIRFSAVDKTLARQHVLARYGADRSRWPYDPRRRGNGGN